MKNIKTVFGDIGFSVMEKKHEKIVRKNKCPVCKGKTNILIGSDDGYTFTSYHCPLCNIIYIGG